jgi:hypothetical protein
MSQRLPCPNGHVLVIPPKLAGKRIKCPKCQAPLEVPILTAAEEEEEIITEAAEEEAPKSRPAQGIKKGPPPLPRAPRDEDRDERKQRNRFQDDDDDEAPQRRRRPIDDDDEDDDRPRVRRRRAEDDWEEDERPRSRRRKRNRRQNSLYASIFGNLSEGKVALIGFGVILLFLALSFISPVFALIPLLASVVLTLGGGIWFLVIVFKDNPVKGVLCMVIPLYSLFYLLSNFEEVKRPFFAQLAGVLLGFATTVAMGFSKEGNNGRPNRLGENPNPAMIFARGCSGSMHSGNYGAVYS